jgi:cell division transport system ATP-binding protein
MLINLINATINIEEREILKNVNFSVSENDFIYIVGKVGSGKSSLLKSLYGELPIKGDTTEILYYDLSKMKQHQLPELRRELGIIFQDFQLLSDYTVQENLDFVLRVTDWEKEDRAPRIAEVLKQVGISEKANNYPHELSGGEQQRVAIARALLNSPKVILADEPTGNLDKETSDNIMTILHGIRQQGTAVVMITHNLHLINEYPGTAVYKCENGNIIPTNGQIIATNEQDADNEELTVDC